MKWFWPNEIKLIWSSILVTQDQAKDGRDWFLNPKLTWYSSFQATMYIWTQDSLRFTISNYFWDLRSQTFMRYTIKSYHILVLSHQVNYTRSDYTMQLEAILVNHALIHFRLLGQPRIHLCEITWFSSLLISKCKRERKRHHNILIMTSPPKP